MYFKIIRDDNIVGIASDFNLRKHQPKHNLILFADIETAQYVDVDGRLYRDNWLRKPTSDKIEFIEAEIVSIEEDEYNALQEAFETVGEIAIEPEPEPEPEPIDTDDPDATLEFVRNAKIEQMSRICRETIINGVDVVLSDGESHHFSLEIEDQIKIQALAMKAQNGDETLFWHEDNKPCQFYSATDILAIYAALEQIQTFETTWFNSLKMYIMSMNTIEEIQAVTYRTNIPEGFRSEVLKYLLGVEGGND